jgi:hypothetical protein
MTTTPSIDEQKAREIASRADIWTRKAVEQALAQALSEKTVEIERETKRADGYLALLQKLERRIRNQRAANRETWEIVEQRRKWLGSDTARRGYIRILRMFREANSRSAAAEARLSEVVEECARIAETAGRVPVGAGDGGTYVVGSARDAANAIRARFTTHNGGPDNG